LPVPADKILQRVLDECLNCQPDASPLVQWPGAEIRRYRDRLFIMPPLPEVGCDQHHEWQPGETLQLGCPAGVLSSTIQTGIGLHNRYQKQRLEIRFRQGGEVLQPVSRGQTHALKKLLQDKGVPGWERERLPLLYADGKLVAVPDICICEGCQTEQDQPGYFPRWSRLEAYL
jgi:tRNA(Ile)-lysidine synthase